MVVKELYNILPIPGLTQSFFYFAEIQKKIRKKLGIWKIYLPVGTLQKPKVSNFIPFPRSILHYKRKIKKKIATNFFHLFRIIFNWKPKFKVCLPNWRVYKNLCWSTLHTTTIAHLCSTHARSFYSFCTEHPFSSVFSLSDHFHLLLQTNYAIL